MSRRKNPFEVISGVDSLTGKKHTTTRNAEKFFWSTTRRVVQCYLSDCSVLRLLLNSVSALIWLRVRVQGPVILKQYL